jgi:hypothetical protein
MASMTLLEMVQNILSEMSSDEVNDIDDTAESNQVVEIIKVAFLAICSNRDWLAQRRACQFIPSGNLELPTHMTLEDPIKEMMFVNYDCQRPEDLGKPVYMEIKYLYPDDFLRRLNNNYNSLNDNVQVVIDPTSRIQLFIRNDYPPTYYTSFDDNTLIFDSYDSKIENTIQACKIQSLAYFMPKFEYDNDWIAPLPDEAFVALLEEAKSRAFLALKQQANQKAEQEAARQQAWLSRKQWRVKGGVRYENYGRIPKNGYAQWAYTGEPTFRRDNM